MDDEQSLVRGWFLERSLVRVRWWMMPLCLVLLPLFRHALWPFVLLSIAALGIGNAWLMRDLRGSPEAAHLQRARLLATGLEWLTAISLLGLSSPDPTTVAPDSLLILLVVIGFRYGRRELLAAAVATGAIMALLSRAPMAVRGSVPERRLEGDSEMGSARHRDDPCDVRAPRCTRFAVAVAG